METVRQLYKDYTDIGCNFGFDICFWGNYDIPDPQIKIENDIVFFCMTGKKL